MVYRLLGWRGEVEDIVQDVFLAAFKRRQTFRDESSQWTWLAAIAINRCRTHRRRKLLEFRWLKRPRTNPALERISNVERRRNGPASSPGRGRPAGPGSGSDCAVLPGGLERRRHQQGHRNPGRNNRRSAWMGAGEIAKDSGRDAVGWAYSPTVFRAGPRGGRIRPPYARKVVHAGSNSTDSQTNGPGNASAPAGLESGGPRPPAGPETNGSLVPLPRE